MLTASLKRLSISNERTRRCLVFILLRIEVAEMESVGEMMEPSTKAVLKEKMGANACKLKAIPIALVTTSTKASRVISNILFRMSCQEMSRAAANKIGGKNSGSTISLGGCQFGRVGTKPTSKPAITSNKG